MALRWFSAAVFGGIGSFVVDVVVVVSLSVVMMDGGCFFVVVVDVVIVEGVMLDAVVVVIVDGRGSCLAAGFWLSVASSIVQISLSISIDLTNEQGLTMFLIILIENKNIDRRFFLTKKRY